MTIDIQQGDVLQTPCDLLVVHAVEGAGLHGAAKAVDAAMEGALSDLMKQDGFLGKKGERIVFPTFGKLKARKVAVIGCGAKRQLSADGIRTLGATLIRVARDAKAKKVASTLPAIGVAGLDARAVAQAFGEGMQLGAYRFHAYHGTASKHPSAGFDVGVVTLMDADRATVKSAIMGWSVRVRLQMEHFSRAIW
jgi:leucyl aminopeptidase